MRRTVCILIGRLMLLPAVGWADELLVNPNFDGIVTGGKPIGWVFDGAGKFSVASGFGRNGGMGLMYRGDGGPREVVSQYVKVHSGMSYRFTGWARTVGISSDKGVMLRVSLFDAGGQWVETSFSSSVRGTSEDWTPLEVDVEPPKKAVRAQLSVWVSDGETGTAYFDDFSFQKSQKPLVKVLVSDVYRDTASDETVGFRLVSGLTDAEIASKGLNALAFVPDAGGDRHLRTVRVAGPSDGVWRFSVDLSGLPYGELPVSVALEESDGARVATATLIVNHVRTLPRRQVWIDRQRRTIVDGRPFFPFGMFTDNLKGERAEEYARGPFNCVLPYATLRREELDWAEKRGLKVIYSLKDHYRGSIHQALPMYDEEDELAVVSATVAVVRDHPALLAWYLADEIGPGMVPRLKSRDRLLRRLDPDHPTMNCLCRPDVARDYMDTTDILGGDPYPIRAGISSPKIADVAGNTRTLDMAYFHSRPLWQVPQAFDWSYIHKDEGRSRYPTKGEILNMCLQCVAEGANGLVLWAYYRVGQTACGFNERDLRWRELCEVGVTVREMIPVFLSDDISCRVSGRKDDLPIRAWRHGGKTWVLAVNAGYERSASEVSVDGRSLRLDLPPLGYFFGPM